MVANKKKEADYVQKLYIGLRSRYKEGKSTSGGQRVLPTTGKGKDVLEKCKMKCAICPAKYQDQPAGFEIHHVDGNRTNTVMPNLVLLCGTCHNTVHSKANTLLDDYKKTHPLKPPKPPKPKEVKPSPDKKKKPTGRQLKCAYCKGTGRDPVLLGMCRACGGDGRVPPDRKKKCAYCNNTGEDPFLSIVPCQKCHGLGYIK